MVILLKIKRRYSFFIETAFLFWCHALWKLGSSNCWIFEMKHVTGMKTCTKIYFLFILNLVWIRIRKISLFWLYHLMLSLWKPSIRLLSIYLTSWLIHCPDLSRAYNMVRVIEGKIVYKWSEGKQKLLWVSGRFELSRVLVTKGKITVM